MARKKEGGIPERGGEGSNACVPGNVVEGYLSVFNISAFFSSVINAIFLFEYPPPRSTQFFRAMGIQSSNYKIH